MLVNKQFESLKVACNEVLQTKHKKLCGVILARTPERVLNIKQTQDDTCILEYTQLLFQVTTKYRQQMCVYYTCTKYIFSVNHIDYCTGSYSIKQRNIIILYRCLFH